jgi:beta-glucanase (GH16 family)
MNSLKSSLSWLLAAIAATTATIATNVSMCDDNDWHITFHEEFTGTQLNSSNWIALDNKTHGTTEKELYLANNVRVENGTLILTTKEQKAIHSATQQRYNFTSGWVESKHKRSQKYGRFEVRAKLPSPDVGMPGQWPSAWPAHWLMPDDSSICWPVGGEIDIMEAYRPTPSGQGSVLMTYHWASTCNQDQWDRKFGKFPNTSNETVIDWFHEYHTFGVEWKTDTIEWYIDGVIKYVRTKDQPKGLFIPDTPFYMILNTAMEPWSNDDMMRGLPSEHIIDWVKWCQPN